MRIGAIAQHANIGPTSPTSIIPNAIPGRLNDFSIWAWWDFTDSNVVTPSNSTLNLQNVDDKGSNNVQLVAENASKGPSWNPSSGQDGYNVAQTFDSGDGSGADFMSFTNPSDLNSRSFTSTIIFDMNSSSVSGNQFFYKINGSGNEEISLYWDNLYGRLFAGVRDASNNQYFIYSTDANQRLDDQVGGDFNYNFNWITFSLQSDGTMKLYLRGKPITIYQSGTLPSFTVAHSGTKSFLFDSSGDENSSAGNEIRANIYEVMLFEEAINEQQLYNIDMYIKTKYSGYQYGRINGY
jgi:hypothetical protein